MSENITDTNESNLDNVLKNDPRSILRVKSSTPVKSLAGSIIATMKEVGHVSLRCIGDGAIGHGIRATAIAAGPLTQAGVNIKLKPYYFVTKINDEERTGIAIDIDPE